MWVVPNGCNVFVVWYFLACCQARKHYEGNAELVVAQVGVYSDTGIRGRSGLSYSNVPGVESSTRMHPFISIFHCGDHCQVFSHSILELNDDRRVTAVWPSLPVRLTICSHSI